MDKVKTLLPLAREQVENFKEKGKDGSSDLKQEVVTISLENGEQCCPGEPVQIWLQVDGQHLLHSDCDILQEGGHLNDKHITFKAAVFLPRRFKSDSIPKQGAEKQNKRRATYYPLQEERSLGGGLKPCL